MTGNRRSDRALAEPREIGPGMLASRRTMKCRRWGQGGESWVGCLFERLVVAAIASQASPKASRWHAREGTGAIQRP
jgi:hypothetical protein